MTHSGAVDPGVELMLAYQAGSEEAFDGLVERYSGQVYSLLTRFLGPIAEREDFVQEVFLRVVRARARYQPSARFSTWLYRIAFNLCVNRTERRTAREAPGDGTSAGRPVPSVLDPGDPLADEPSTRMERADAVRAVRAAVSALPETQRMALILAKYHELPYAEIAAVMDSSEKAIKSLIHRGRENLRERLAPLFEEELS